MKRFFKALVAGDWSKSYQFVTMAVLSIVLVAGEVLTLGLMILALVFGVE